MSLPPEALWHACAGPLVAVPIEGERVFYFPQGHLERVEASTNQVIDLPRNDLPWKILCRVINVQLKAEADTDEVFAQVTVLPEPNQDENGAEMEPPLPPLPELLEHSFCKTLTPSDTNIHGGFSVFNRHANACFPPLDMSRQPPKQELVARDLHGNEWRFEHVFKGNNINLNNELLYFIFDSHEDWDARSTTKALAYKRLEGFLSSKRPVAGDAFVFLRGGNGQLRVGLRRALRPQGNVPSIINSSPGMFDEVLSAAWEAFTRRTLFTISYKPRTSPAEFVVPVDQYMESMRRHYTIGMRFQMRFESEEAPEHRFSGAIVGIEDADPIKWPGSKWRCLKVRWDQNGTPSTPRAGRVSPWKVERFKSSSNALIAWKKIRCHHPLILLLALRKVEWSYISCQYIFIRENCEK